MGFDPLTMMAVSTVASAGGSILQGQQQRRAANAQAAELDMQAAQERDAAMAQAEKIRRAGRYQTAEADAGYAASGVSVDTGTPVEVGRAIRRNAEEDAYNTILTGERRGRSLNTQADQARRAGKNAAAAGIVNAASSVLSNGYSYSRWRTANQRPLAPIEERSSYGGIV